jgi:hypothetical protein
MSEEKERIILGKWSRDELGHIIREASHIEDVGKRIDFLSRQLLHVNYRESTLIGDIITPEVLVINLEGVDCFTFIDYVEAMRLSTSFLQFKENLKKVRYKSGEVAFENRNHFFTDWQRFNKRFVNDITEDIGVYRIKSVRKVLNKRKDGTYFLPGIDPYEQEINYIPAKAMDSVVINKLRTGNYVGIYADIPGLDVSHAGIIIKYGNTVYLRHASSLKECRKVVDQNFKQYIADKPGVVVLQPKG